MFTKFDKVIRCLAIQLPSEVWDDINTEYGKLKAEVEKFTSTNSSMPKCLCEVYNVGEVMGDIAIDKDCPFHGILLNTSA